MQLTATQVVTRALRLIRVIGQDDTPSAADLSAGFDALVSMLDGWAGDQGFVPDIAEEFLTPGFVDLTTPITIEDGSYGLRRMIEHTLAVELASEFGVAAPAQVTAISQAAIRNWKRKVAGLHIGRIRHDELSNAHIYNVTTDETV